jgi:hypothetical protein
VFRESDFVIAFQELKLMRVREMMMMMLEMMMVLDDKEVAVINPRFLW